MTKMINTRTAVFGTALCAGAMLMTASLVQAGACKGNKQDKACKAEGGEATEACKAKCAAEGKDCKADAPGKCADKQDACEAKAADVKATDAKVQTECPVMGGKINKAVYVDHDGKRIYLCCQGCIGAVKKDPAKYIKALEDQGVTLETVSAVEN